MRKPCLDCGVPASSSRCELCAAQVRHPSGKRKTHNTSGSKRGYDARWQRLSRLARRIQPWCSDCHATSDLTGEHLAWPARTIADVMVLCRSCNSKRGAKRRTVNGQLQPLETTVSSDRGVTPDRGLCVPRGVSASADYSLHRPSPSDGQ